MILALMHSFSASAEARMPVDGPAHGHECDPCDSDEGTKEVETVINSVDIESHRHDGRDFAAWPTAAALVDAHFQKYLLRPPSA